jgi:hypothetical protein
MARSNGFQRTSLEECWRPSFARSHVPELGGLERDLEHYLAFYTPGAVHVSARDTRRPRG